jgi:hypothetical protein
MFSASMAAGLVDQRDNFRILPEKQIKEYHKCLNGIYMYNRIDIYDDINTDFWIMYTTLNKCALDQFSKTKNSQICLITHVCT